MYNNLNLNHKLSLLKLILSLFTSFIFLFLSLIIIGSSIRNDVQLSNTITGDIFQYSLLLFVGVAGIIFILYIIESSVFIKKFFKRKKQINRKYITSHYLESIVWITCITIMSFILIYYYRLSYLHYYDFISLIIFGIFCIIFVYISVMLTSIFKLKNNFSTKKIKLYSTVFLLVFILSLSFIFLPIIQGIFYTPMSDKPNDFEMVMSADKFLNATPHYIDYTKDTIYKNSLESSDGYPINVELKDKFYSPYYNIYENSFIISTSKYDKAPSYNPPEIKTDKNEQSVHKLFNNTQNKEIEFINLYYFTNQKIDGNELYSYEYSTKNYMYQANLNADIHPNYYAYTDDLNDRDEINSYKFDINKFNESNTQPTGFGIINWVTSSIMVSTGEKEYYDKEVIIYKNMWYQISQYIPLFDSSEIYVDKDTGAILKSESPLSDSNYVVRPYNKTFETPEFVENFEGNTIDTVEEKPFYDVNTSESDVNINLYGLSTYVEKIEFTYGNQSKIIDESELENVNKNNPKTVSFDKKHEKSDINIYFDGRNKYNINI